MNSLTFQSVGVSTSSSKMQRCFQWSVDFCECKGHVSGVITSAAVQVTLVSEVCSLKAPGEEDLKGFTARKQVASSLSLDTQKQANLGHICLFVHKLCSIIMWDFIFVVLSWCRLVTVFEYFSEIWPLEHHFVNTVEIPQILKDFTLKIKDLFKPANIF